MRKVILDLAVTLDGFIEGPNGEIDWLASDEEIDFAEILNEILRDIDAIFYGRISYELWGNYSPPEDARENLKEAYRLLHSKTKYIFSSTKNFDAENVFTINTVDKEEIQKILEQSGQNIWLYGGGKLTTEFINAGLINIYRLAVHPVILGGGKPLFSEIKNRVTLKNPNAIISKSGVVLLSYEAEKKH